jgi:hypothetical protein
MWLRQRNIKQTNIIHNISISFSQMDFPKSPAGKKLVLLLLSLIWMAYLIFLIYTLVYSGKESVYRKNAFVTGLGFLIITWITRSAFKKFEDK